MNNISNSTDSVYGIESRKTLNGIRKEYCNNIPSFNIFAIKISCNGLNVSYEFFTTDKITETFGNIIQTEIFGTLAKKLKAISVFGFNHKNDSFRNNVVLHT